MLSAFEKYKGGIEVDAHLCELAQNGKLQAIFDLNLDEVTQLVLYYMALCAGHVKILDKLSAHMKNQLLMISAYNGNIESIKALLKYQQFMEPQSVVTAFREAATYGYTDVVTALLKTFKQEISQNDITFALKQAIQNKKDKLVKVLFSKEQFGLLYKQELPSFAKLILPREEIDQEQEKVNFESSQPHTQTYTVFNQSGYDQGIEQDWSQDYQQGNALTLADGTPIGYNVFMPKQSVKAVLVRIYGGSEAAQRESLLYRPDEFHDFDVLLLNQGIAVITLNLVDLLKLETYQLEMPRDLHEKLHESIHHFFKTIKLSPDSLDPALARLKGKPCYLYGESFGGAMVIRHGQIYPYTFNGYISFDGAISIVKSYETNKMYNIKPSQEILDAQHWLCPTFGVERLRRPLLLLHNADDNNVTMPVTLDFMKKAKKAGKQDLIRLLITDHGSPVEAADLFNTGHSLPKDKRAYERIVSTVSSFVLQGPSTIRAVTDWHAHKYGLSSHHDNPSASLEDKFNAASFSLYQGAQDKGSGKDKISPHDILSEDKARQERAWQMYYVPIYRVLYYMDKLKSDVAQYYKCLKRLESLKLSEDEVKRVLGTHLKSFVKYVKEKYDVENINADALLQDKALQATFKRLLLNVDVLDNATHLYLLSTLFMANPDLVENETKHLMYDAAEKAQLRNARQSLIKAINKNKSKIRAIWKEAAKEGIKLSAAQKKVTDPSTDYFERRQLIRDAAYKGDLKLIKLILDDKQLQIDDNIKEQAFTFAVIGNQTLVAMYLLNKCPQALGQLAKIQALKSAVDNENTEMFDLLMDYYGKHLRRFELGQVLGAKRAQAYFNDDNKSARKWPKVVTDADNRAKQENILPNQSKSKRPLPPPPQKQTQENKPTSHPTIKSPVPVRPKRKY